MLRDLIQKRKPQLHKDNLKIIAKDLQDWLSSVSATLLCLTKKRKTLTKAKYKLVRYTATLICKPWLPLEALPAT